jgi:ubiquinone/menaquinone biosynthesis C-methylase UbiE
LIRYPYTDPQLVAAGTQEAVRRDVRVLQIYRLAEPEGAHCIQLLRTLDPPPDALVADLGSGIGTVAHWMSRVRPDLRFIEINIAQYQLELSEGERRVQADMERLPLASGALDCAMLLYSIGHADAQAVLEETARVLRPDGVLLLWDMVSEQAEVREAMQGMLHYRVLAPRMLESAFQGAGYRLDRWEIRRGPIVRGIFTPAQKLVLRGVAPVLVRAVRV